MKRLFAISLAAMFILSGCSDGASETVSKTDIIENTEIAAADPAEMTTAPISETTAEITTVTVTEALTETTAATTTAAPIPPPDDGKLVRILDYIPDAVIDLRYATNNNFTGEVLYDDPEAYICYGTVKKLMNVQEQLKKEGLRIRIWDAYRSPEAQERLWQAYPDPIFVADPRNGLTSHSKGGTVDISVVGLDGSEPELPSAFDEFSAAADRDYSDVSEKAAENARLLEEIMYSNGFTGYSGEWWDYTDTEQYNLIP